MLHRYRCSAPATARLFLPLAAAGLCLVLASAASNPAAEAAAKGGEQASGARYPALTPDGQTVAFEYWGDIWSAPVDGSAPARRLTDHAAWDYLPRYSPDGTQLAFVSRRNGNDDIWVMPADGGAARQVTTHSGTDILDAWLPDGSGLVFHSNRGLWASDIYTVPVPREGRADQGAETQLTAADHYSCSFAQPLSDGGFVMQRGGGRWWRKRYRGAANNQLWRLAPPGWIFDGDGAGIEQERGTMTQLTSFDGRNDWPMVGKSGWIYYVSDRDGIDNIYGLDPNLYMDLGSMKTTIRASGPIDNEPLQITHHSSDGVQWPSLQPGGDRIVYDFDGGLWVVDGQGPRQLDIRIAGETKDNPATRTSFADQANELAVSPNGKYVVVVNNGDLWAVRDPETYGKDSPPDQDLTRALRLTATDGARERNPAFAPDSRHLAYSSDADGAYNLYVMDLADRSIKQVTHGATADHLQADFDPTSSDTLFAYSGNSELRRYNLKDGTDSLVARGVLRDSFSYSGFDVSPDGKWVAYVNNEADYSSEIYVAPADGSGAPVNITRDPNSDRSPQWSRDGSRLIWRSDRDDETTQWFAVELHPAQLPITADFYLKDEPADNSPDKAKDVAAKDGDDAAKPSDAEAKAGGKDDKDKPAKADKPKKKVEVKIDFDDIQYRARRLTHQEGVGSGVLSDDGKWLVYQADPDGTGAKLWTVRADPRPEGAKAEGWEAQRAQDGGWSQAQLTADGKRIYYLESAGDMRGMGRRAAPTGSPVRYAKLADGKLAGKESIALHGDFTLDQHARWQQMLREGWHILGQRWYDPAMHGADWNAVYAKYAPYMDHIRTPEEFEFVFNELMGELNGSHLGITMASSSYSGGGPNTGHLGLELSDGSVSLPWSGAERGLQPASGGGQKAALQAGLTVTHITYRGPADQDGVDLQLGDTVLSIDGRPVGPGMRWYDLLQDKAGQPVRLRVSRGGKEHDTVLKSTDWATYQGLLYREWEKLNEDKVKQLSGGRIGYIHIASMSGSELTKFQREFFSETWDKDALIVDVRFNPGGNIHEELFDLLDRQPFGWNVGRDAPWVVQPAHAWLKPKALLINARSGSDAEIFPSGWRQQKFGPVIGTPTAGAVIGTNGFTLVDGTYVRLPMEGWYELSGRNLETQSTPPDISVEVDPNALRQGDDAQLAKAVEVLLEELKKAPPVAKPPQPYPHAG